MLPTLICGSLKLPFTYLYRSGFCIWESVNFRGICLAAWFPCSNVKQNQYLLHTNIKQNRKSHAFPCSLTCSSASSLPVHPLGHSISFPRLCSCSLSLCVTLFRKLHHPSTTTARTTTGPAESQVQLRGGEACVSLICQGKQGKQENTERVEAAADY